MPAEKQRSVELPKPYNREPDTISASDSLATGVKDVAAELESDNQPSLTKDPKRKTARSYPFETADRLTGRTERPPGRAGLRSVLIVGVDGEIGGALREHLLDQEFAVFGTSRRLSSLDQNTVFFDLEQPDFSVFSKHYDGVIFCAGTRSVAVCEQNPEKHRNINVENTINAIKHFTASGSFVVFISSAAVFDGGKPFYKPNDKTCPSSNYGRFKEEVEDFIQDNVSNSACTLRLTKVMTENTPFVKEWNECAQQGKAIRTFDNVLFSPVGIEKVVEGIIILLSCKSPGIFQIGGEKEVSYTEFAYELFKNDPASLQLIRPERKPEIISLMHNSLATALPREYASYERDNLQADSSYQIA